MSQPEIEYVGRREGPRSPRIELGAEVDELYDPVVEAVEGVLRTVFGPVQRLVNDIVYANLRSRHEGLALDALTQQLYGVNERAVERALRRDDVRPILTSALERARGRTRNRGWLLPAYHEEMLDAQRVARSGFGSEFALRGADHDAHGTSRGDGVDYFVERLTE